jgi:hypothetical protein
MDCKDNREMDNLFNFFETSVVEWDLKVHSLPDSAEGEIFLAGYKKDEMEEFESGESYVDWCLIDEEASLSGETYKLWGLI